MNGEKTTWYAVEVETAAAAEEAVGFALDEAGSNGIEIDQLGRKDADGLKIVGYFEEKPDLGAFRQKLDEALRIHSVPAGTVRQVSCREVPDEDWLAEWKKHWRPTRTGRFVVAPPWAEAEITGGRILIRIEPNMAFGTGTHETTRLCLREIEENHAPGMSFLDVGTGTGILAVAVARLNAEAGVSAPVLGCDTDADSVRIARENAVLNGTPEIEFREGPVTRETPVFDLVCANVTADVIVPLLPLLLEKTRKTLILSGILSEQEQLVRSELGRLGAGGKTRTRTDGEWISVTISEMN